MAYSAYNAYLSVNPSTRKGFYKESQQQLVNFQFQNAPNYEVIERQNRTTGVYEEIGVRLVQAFEVDGKDMISSDDMVTIQFQDLDQSDIFIGDMYEFSGYRWITTETKTTATIAKSCLVKKCNATLSFTESTPLTSSIITIDAFIDFKVSQVATEQYKTVPHAKVTAKVQYNDDTKKIKYDTKKGTRFILGDPASAWQVVNIDAISGVKRNVDGDVTDGVLTLYLEQIQLHPKDNLTDNVAWQMWF